jgi:hypothetical protein
MRSVMRLSAAIAGVLLLIGAVGFFTQQAWALGLWPWTGYDEGLTRLSSIFLASILVAAGVPVLWAAYTGDIKANAAGALDIFINFTGVALFAFQGYIASSSKPPAVLIAAIASAVIALIMLGSLFALRKVSPQDARPMPRVVRVSFAIFAALLLFTGGAMALKQPNVFPWRLTTEMSVVYGWIFLGASAYFIHGFVVGKWYNATGQLLGFLAYDLVLIVPFIQHLNTVAPSMRFNLIFYIGVLVYSGGIAIWYLFIDPRYRIIGVQPQPAH